MGRNGWLDAVKKALKSPTKQMYTSTKTLKARMREEDEPQVDQDKKRSKRRWIFKKTALHETTTILHDESSTSLSTSGTKPIMSLQAVYPDQEIKQAVATTAAAVEVIRLTSPSFEFRNHINAAALVIQTSFRRYLARRALEALKGVVKLQALVRGHNVRRRTKMTLKCMQALVRVQAQVCDQRRKLISNEGSYQDSAYTHCNSSWDERRDTSVKTVQVDTCSQRLSPRWKISQNQRLDSYPSASSPLHYHRFQSQSPITPSSPNSRIRSSVKMQHSASPRCLRSGTQTPSYMSATVSSAMAQIRPQSTPRQRMSPTHDQGERKTTSARKRLSFNVSEKYHGNASDSELDCNSLRSPIHMMERRLSMSSCYKQRIEGDVSRPSISQDRSWLR